MDRLMLVAAKPILKPLMKSATTGLVAASGEVIDSHDQYEVSLPSDAIQRNSLIILLGFQHSHRGKRFIQKVIGSGTFMDMHSRIRPIPS